MELKSKKYPIPSQLPNERIIYFIHRHWFAFVKLFFFIFFMALLPLILYLFIIFQLPEVWESFSGPFILLIGIYLLIVISFGLVLWMNYFFDILIITNRRIIEIEQRTLFNRAVFSVEIIHVEDVSVEVKGMFATFFGYGDLEVQTAGTSRNFIFHQIPDPYSVARKISTLYNKLAAFNHAKKNNQNKSHTHVRDDELRELKKFKNKKSHYHLGSQDKDKMS
jgi:hypothetical protein